DAEDEAVLALAHTLLDAARQGDGDTLLPLIDRGAPVDLRDSAGNSPLMLAAYHGHAALVRELAGRGADVDLANDRGQGPLAGAGRRRRPGGPRGWAPPLTGQPAGLLSGPGAAHHRDVLDAGLEEQSADGLEAHRGVPLLEVRLGVDVHVRARQSRGDMLERG